MIQFLEHKRIDKKKWDDCIRDAPNGMVYARSWYLDVVSPGWNALADADYKTVFPLTWRKKAGFHYLYQPPFTQQLGIFSIEKNISEKMVQDFLDAIPGNYRLAEIQLNAGNSLTKSDFKIFERLTHHLNLDQLYEKIYSGYSDNLKRNMKRAGKDDIELSHGIAVSEIIRLFRQNKGKDVDNLGKREYDVLLQLIKEADKRKLVSMLGAKTPAGDYCAGAVFLRSNREYIFLFSAADETARQTGAMSFVIDSFIRSHSYEKMALDFEGSMDKNLARFYKSFGSREVVYLQIKKNNLPVYLRWIKK